ncbi:MAG: hypothetical protein J6I69_02455 [Bacilli bacterium]|nr:hypothetical protein [Bacilli bacterium]
MHTRIIEDANLEQLKDFAHYSLGMVKRIDEDVYKDIEMYLYKEVYGCHFTKWLLDKALSEMMNEDGSIGGHWTIEQTTSVAKNNNIEFNHFNEYDFNYTMNLMYSDYYGAVSNDVSSYLKLARKFLEDKDSNSGKALKYYLAMK